MKSYLYIKLIFKKVTGKNNVFTHIVHFFALLATDIDFLPVTKSNVN